MTFEMWARLLYVYETSVQLPHFICPGRKLNHGRHGLRSGVQTTADWINRFAGRPGTGDARKD